MAGANATKKLAILTCLTILFFGSSSITSFANNDKTSQLILQVNNLSCRDCHRTIIGGLQQLDKDILLNSNRDKKSLIITYPDSVKDNEIIRTIQKLGYKAGFTYPRERDGKVAHTRKGNPVNYGYCTSTCSASSNTWKEFYRRYFTKNK